MRFLLDTNVLSEGVRPQADALGVVAPLGAQSADEVGSDEWIGDYHDGRR